MLTVGAAAAKKCSVLNDSFPFMTFSTDPPNLQVGAAGDFVRGLNVLRRPLRNKIRSFLSYGFTSHKGRSSIQKRYTPYLLIVSSKLSSIFSTLNRVLQSLFRRTAREPHQVISISSTSSIRIIGREEGFQCAINLKRDVPSQILRGEDMAQNNSLSEKNSGYVPFCTF